MWRKLTIALSASVVVSACAVRAQPDAPRTNWGAVMALSAEEQIEVLTRDHRRVVGTLESVNADRLVVGPVSVTLSRIDITAVWTVPREDSLFNGYLVGAIVGLAFGGFARAKGNEAFLIPASTAAVGSAVGAWLDRGWNGPPRRLVYRVIN